MAKRRRGAGEGSIYKRADGRWTGSVQTGVDANGKRRRQVVYGATRGAVLAKFDELRVRVAEGVVVDPGRLTAGGYLERWIEDTARPRIRRSTYHHYQRLLRHTLPRLGCPVP